jgi:hypothetical protein
VKTSWVDDIEALGVDDTEGRRGSMIPKQMQHSDDNENTEMVPMIPKHWQMPKWCDRKQRGRVGGGGEGGREGDREGDGEGRTVSRVSC